ncbi:MAG: DUF6122 family protein [Flavobacteriaceae bacterium]
MRFFVHYFLHLGLPLLVAFFFFKKERIKVGLLLLATLLVDLDHLWASPIYDPERCSIGFHLLHQNFAIAFYVGLLFLKKPLNYIGLGLVLHMLTDTLDCWWMGL